MQAMELALESGVLPFDIDVSGVVVVVRYIIVVTASSMSSYVIFLYIVHIGVWLISVL